jgi:hypothetical protein
MLTARHWVEYRASQPRNRDVVHGILVRFSGGVDPDQPRGAPGRGRDAFVHVHDRRCVLKRSNVDISKQAEVADDARGQTPQRQNSDAAIAKFRF